MSTDRKKDLRVSGARVKAADVKAVDVEKRPKADDVWHKAADVSK